jgi:hypothetical protein
MYLVTIARRYLANLDIGEAIQIEDAHVVTKKRLADTVSYDIEHPDGWQVRVDVTWAEPGKVLHPPGINTAIRLYRPDTGEVRLAVNAWLKRVFEGCWPRRQS